MYASIHHLGSKLKTSLKLCNEKKRNIQVILRDLNCFQCSFQFGNGILLSCQLFGEDFFDFLVRFFSCLDFQEAGNQKFKLRDPEGVKQFNLPRLPASRKAKQLKNRGQNSKKGQAVS